MLLLASVCPLPRPLRVWGAGGLHMCISTWRSLRKVLGPPELELQAVRGHLMCVPGTKLRSCRRIKNSLNCSDISLVPIISFFKKKRFWAFYSFPFVSREFIIDFCSILMVVALKFFSDNSSIWFISVLTLAGFLFYSMRHFLGCWLIFWIFCLRLWVIFYRATLFCFVYKLLPAIQQLFQK